MAKYFEKIINVETCEETLKEFTEIEEKNQDLLIAKNLEISQKEAELEAKAQIEKAALLDKLGITAEEAKLLLS